MAGCQKWKPVFVILAVYFAMAVFNILLKRVLSEGIDQLVMITYRLTAAAIFLAPIAFFFERRSGDKLTAPILCHLFFSALVGALTTQFLYLHGLLYTSAAFASAFTNMTPVVTFLLAVLLRQESVKLRSKGGVAKVLGSLICFGGVILLIFYRGIPLNKATTHSRDSTYSPKNSRTEAKGDTTSQRWFLGSIYLLLAILFWSAWFLIQARIGKKYPFKYSSTAVMSLFGGIQSAILCFSINRDFSVWVLKGEFQILTTLFAGIVGSGLCYVGMAWCVEQRGPVFTSAFSPFIQIFITILDLAFFHEQIHLGSVIGSVLVVFGLYTLLWGKSIGDENRVANNQAEAVECDANPSYVTQVTTNSSCPS